ncbi:hypothetical protein [Sulfuricurvum sp.]|uniref:hypothetical protein n=1 Tax=Sulfuricurvum sp. TaxID=2025608 RepID=UPI002E342BC0|nr:hypothetical protein [Sulfuricurvum sp.]HEX5329071.1 hypothetical protein [Sulfuricurvum sp.]
MFALILKFQSLMEQLRKNKRLWFTSITIIAFLGIAGTLHYLNSTTERSAKNLYEATSSAYFLELDSKLLSAQQQVSILGSSLMDNQPFVAMISNQANSAVNSQKLKQIADNVNTLSKNQIALELYDKNRMKTASSIENMKVSTQPYDSKALQKAITSNTFTTAVEYQDGQVYIRAFFPIPTGVLEVKKSVDYLIDEYAGNNQMFQVVLDKDFLDMKRVQEYSYKKIGKSEISVQSKSDDTFMEYLATLDFDQLVTDKYILADDYFIMGKPILDSDGKRIGIFLIGEYVLKDDSLPKMTKSISTGITTAAMGLVVSLLILMI